jgi:DNA gyrase/topoisomerase IV subunit B
MCDQDVDALRIISIGLAFFCRWPWLLRAGCICRNNTPMMVCTKGNDVVNIYTWKEYKDREKELKNYKIEYKKGLGSLEPAQFAAALRNPHLQIFKLDDEYQMSLFKWFGKKHIKDRQNSLKGDIMD